ncbi:MAG TPA: regulatory protein RecX [Candidatus Andersenbacteria bacterium]|nr:regulatory protein RecX [Candidatus Andersenbacteria bacterium]
MSKTPRELAIDILARRDHSIREMRKKLQKKNITSELINETIAWLIDKRLLNDREFAQKKAESIMRTKMCGPRYIEYKLREAGIASDIIDDVLGKSASDHEWQQRAKKALVQWKKIHPKHTEDRIRQQRFLASRGFDRIHI